MARIIPIRQLFRAVNVADRMQILWVSEMLAVISVKPNARVFIVEDNAERIEWFRGKLGNRIVGIEKDPDEAVLAIAYADPHTLDAIFLDYDLGPEQHKNSTITSKPIVDYLNMTLTRRADQRRIIIHSQNVVGATWMNALLPGAIRLPFGDFDIQEMVKDDRTTLD